MAEITLVQAVHDGLREEMRRDERVVVLGEDVGRRGGVFRVTEGFVEEFGEARVLDTPLAECGIAGVAIGMAFNGLLPVAEIQFADFIHPAINQIINEAARIRYRSNGDWTCPIVVRAPYGGGIHGGLYHSQSVEAFFFHTPGLKVVAPCTPYDAKGLLKSAIRDPDPVLYFEHKKTYRSVKGDVPESDYLLPIGRADVKRVGKHISVLTYGLMVHHSLAAAATLEREGVSVEVVDLRTIAPLDKGAILRSVQKTGKALVVYEANLTGGVGAEVVAIIAQEAFEFLDGPVMRLAAPDVPAMPYAPTMEEAFMPSPEKIAAALRQLAAY